MEEIDTRALSNLLFVLKAGDVARFKYRDMEIEFATPQPEEEGERAVDGFTHPPVKVAEPPPPDERTGYHALFGGNPPKFPRAAVEEPKE